MRPEPKTCMPLGRRYLLHRAAIAILLVVVPVCLDRLDKAFPPPIGDDHDYSVEVLDRSGAPLKVFTDRHGRWRLKADLDQIDPRFIEMLIGYEDRRFYAHHGVDLLALTRAARQWLANGRIVSGGSTITMQLARLLEPRNNRTIGAKLFQVVRALQIERRLDKRGILERYLAYAPYGGNIEGARAASLAWFGKEPTKLALREAALLVALPQSPERRRPDRFPAAAKAARDRVLLRLTAAGLVDPREARRVSELPITDGRHAMPSLAPHLAQEALDRDPVARVHHTHIDAQLQTRLEKIAKNAVRRLPPRVSVAIVAADARSGEILARVGSPDINDERRSGWVDMTGAVRSPGSTLKPFVYGLAIEDGLVLPETMISDRPANFDGYRPANFDAGYRGDVNIRTALQWSLNVPAVRLMEAVSPVRLLSRFQRAGVTAALPENEPPGLGIILGGCGLTLIDLVQLYANLVTPRISPVILGDGIHGDVVSRAGPKLLGSIAAWHVIDMLAGVPAPAESRQLPIAYKTGTSYGYRDAWSIGFDGQHVIGVWVGRADNGAVPGISGIVSAAPILFRSFEILETELKPFPRAPTGARRLSIDELSPINQRFQPPSTSRINVGRDNQALNVTFPANGSEIELSTGIDGSNLPVVVKLQGGIPPFWLLADDKPVGIPSRRRQLLWAPESRGLSRLTVMDSRGHTTGLVVRISN
jgi:penicillin-binding protein 1C